MLSLRATANFRKEIGEHWLDLDLSTSGDGSDFSGFPFAGKFSLTMDIEPERGSFRARGDVIEIHPAYEEIGYRVEMFGDEGIRRAA